MTWTSRPTEACMRPHGSGERFGDDRKRVGTDRGTQDQVDRRDPRRPVAGTQLRRQWQGTERVVTVREHDFEYNGRPYKSLSAIAREIAGTRWNGWLFFGLRHNGTTR